MPGILKKENLFYLWLALLPFLSVSPWQVLFVKPLYLGFIHYSLLLILLLIQGYEDFRAGKIKIHPVFFLFLGFGLVAALSLFLNWRAIDGVVLEDAAGLKAPHVYNLFLLVYLFLNILTVWAVSRRAVSKPVLEKSAKIIVYSSALACVYGIAVILLIMAGALPSETVTFFPRLQGSATEPQVFGNFLLVGIPLAFAFFMADPGRLNSGMLFTLSLALVMTFSMGAWVGAAGALVLFILPKIKQINLEIIKKSAAILGLIAVAFFGLCYLYPAYPRSLGLSKLQVWKINEEVAYYQKSNQYPDTDDKLLRVWMAQTALNQFKSSPLIGVGPGDYGFLYNKFRPEKSIAPAYPEKAHNAYLEVLAETGALGFALFFGAVFYLFLRAAALYFKNKKKTPIVYAAIAGLFGLFIHGLSFGIFAHNYTWALLGFVLAAGEIKS